MTAENKTAAKKSKGAKKLVKSGKIAATSLNSPVRFNKKLK